jgi:phosphoribosyl 1,2-cyclic phosphodiesterase
VRFASLGSGSEGNALLVESGSTRLLLDCGFSVSDTVRRLQRLSIEPEDLTGIVVTHEHDDHISGVGRLARRYELPVWLTPGTLRGMEALLEGVDLRPLEGYAPAAVGALELMPFPVPHDAREPAQYVFSDGARRLGVLTDAGSLTPHIRKMLSRCDALVLECNHDPRMLADSDYPERLKQRIAGRYGHLDNASAAQLLNELDRSRLQHVIAAHLSQTNNRPDLAREALAGALGCAPSWVGLASQDHGFDWRTIAG